MAIQFNKSTLYPEEYIIEEDTNQMGDTNLHTLLIVYLRAVLEWFYQQEQWIILSNCNLYHSAIRNSQKYIVPDLMLIKVAMLADTQSSIKSWRIKPPKQAAPALVFEISSESTWQNDIGTNDYDKPAIYGRIGIREYFSYDPHPKPVWTHSEGVRLRGWRYDQQGQPTELLPDEQGRLWSEELQSFLLPDGKHLRLLDQSGQQRLTETEAQVQARQLEAEARQLAEQRALQEVQAHHREAAARVQAEQARAEAEIRVQQAQAQAQAETQARKFAEQELAQLRQQLARLQNQKLPPD